MWRLYPIMKTQIVQMATVKNVIKNKDIIQWDFRICNNSKIDCYGVEVTFDIPEGLSLIGPKIDKSESMEVPTGVFRKSEMKWIIGDLKAENCTDSVVWEIQVDDIELRNSEDDSFIVNAIVESRCNPESDIDNNKIELMIHVADECPDSNLTVGGEYTQ